MTASKKAKMIVDLIIENLEGRGVLFIDTCDEDIQEEIREDLENIVIGVLG